MVEAEAGAIFQQVVGMPLEELQRRRKAFMLSELDLFELLRLGQHRWFRVRFVGGYDSQGEALYLPPTTVISDLRPDSLGRCFIVILCDVSFPIVSDGASTPYGGSIRLEIGTTPDVEELAKELEAAHAAIHDLKEQLKG